MSNGEYFTDRYYEEMNSQGLFTVTPKQYKDSNYDSDNTVGLTDGSGTFIPAGRVGTVIGSSTVKVAPIVVNSGKNIVDKLDKMENIAGAWISIKKDNLPLPTSVKKWTTDNVTYDDFIIQVCLHLQQ